jgi:hypothetical protein
MNLTCQEVFMNAIPRKTQYFKVQFIDDQRTVLISNIVRSAVWRHLIHQPGTGIVLEKFTKQFHFLLSGGHKNILLFFFCSIC